MTPNWLKLISKGVDSVWSWVMNLWEINSQINHDSWCKELTDSFKNYHQLPIENLELEET